MLSLPVPKQWGFKPPNTVVNPFIFDMIRGVSKAMGAFIRLSFLTFFLEKSPTFWGVLGEAKYQVPQ